MLHNHTGYILDAASVREAQAALDELRTRDGKLTTKKLTLRGRSHGGHDSVTFNAIINDAGVLKER